MLSDLLSLPDLALEDTVSRLSIDSIDQTCYVSRVKACCKPKQTSRQGNSATTSASPTSVSSWGRKWSAAQDQQLKEAVAEIGGARQWKQVAAMVTDRDHVQCRQRFEMMKPGRVKGKWSDTEDASLWSIMSKLGGAAPNWTQIAKSVPGRTAKQCKYRWATQLDPSVNHGPCSRIEIDTFMQLRQQHGRNWVKMIDSGELPGRTAAMLKNYVKREERKQSSCTRRPQSPELLQETKKRFN